MYVLSLTTQKLELSWYIVCVKVVSTSLFLLSSSPLISTHTEALPKPEAIAFGRMWVSREYTSAQIDGQRRSLRRVTRVPQRKNQGHLVVKGRPPQSPQPPAIINRTISWEGLHSLQQASTGPPCGKASSHLSLQQSSTGPSRRKASSHPSLQQSSTGPPRGKASSLQQPSTSHGKGKRKASSPPSLQQPSAKRAWTSTEEEDMHQGDKESDKSDYFLVSMKPIWCSGIIRLSV